MANNRNALRAGVFMIFSVAAAIAIIILVVGGNPFALHLQTHLVRFKLTDNLNGLKKGDDVRVGGMRVGEVREIQFVKRDARGQAEPPEDSILVKFSIPAEYLVAKDATVGIESSLTGVTSLNISNLGEGALQPPELPIQGEPDSLTEFKAMLAQMTPQLKQTVPKVNGTLDSIKDLVAPYRDLGNKVNHDWPDIKDQILAYVKDLKDHGVAMIDTLRDFFGKGSGDFHTTLASLASVTSSFKDRFPTMENSAQEFLDNLNTTMIRLQGSVENIKATIANAKDLTAQLESVVTRNSGRIDEIAAGVKRAVDAGEGFLTELKTQPWKLIYRPSDNLEANMNLYDAARQFAEGANNLQDAATVLRDALKDNRADPAKVQKLYDNLQEQFNRFKAAEDNLWSKVHQ